MDSADAFAIDLPALFKRWADDGEVRIDLIEIGQALTLMMHSGPGPSGPVSPEWAAHFKRLGRLGSIDLSKAAGRFDAPEPGRALAAVAGPGSRALLAARRRWPMALALAGCVEIDPSSPAAAYERMGAIGIEWLARAHPGFRERSAAERSSQAARGLGGDEVAMAVAQEMMSALFDFGRDLGVEDQMAALDGRMAEQRKRMMLGCRPGRARELSQEAFPSAMEAMHLGWAAARGLGRAAKPPPRL